MSARSCAAPPSRTRARSAQKGEITAAQLKAVEDHEIDKIVRKQEEVGLKLATDGEYRRSWWHLDFYWGLTGVEKITLPHGIKFRRRRDAAGGLQDHRQDRLPVRPSDARAFQVPEGAHPRDAEDVHPGADGDALPHAQGRHPEVGLSRPRRLLRRPRQGLRQGGEGVLRRRLPLSAVRRHGLVLSVLGRRDGGGARPHADGGQPAADLSGHDQHRARGEARRHDHHHACLPRQFQIDLGGGGRLRAGRRAAPRRA